MTRLCMIKFDNDYKPTELEGILIRKACIGVCTILSDANEIHYWYEQLVDLDELPLVPYMITKHVWYPPHNPLGLDVDTAGRSLPFNAKCHVSVPGLGLLLLNEVQVEKDCCTDRLNDLLRDGWRIVAVCPQPDQRRPDYVIGRVNASLTGA